ncbi:MAG: AAA family ATPase [Treponema sp.]|nr:AAA family ATPase [Treponema sp.]
MTINAKQLEFILDNTPATQNIMLMGKHGIGKSRILEDYFTKKGQKVVTLFLGQMADPSDLIGLPEKNEEIGKTDFMLPYWFPTDGSPIVLFLDELNRARPEVLQTIMDLTLNRKLAGKSLPKGSRIISAVNNGNEYQLTDLDPALVSRFNIYEFAPSVEDWITWAKKSGIDERVVDFISENPEYLDSFDNGEAENLERSPDRRSWERVSEILKNFSEITFEIKALLTGIIGSEATAVFFDFAKSEKNLSVKTILSSDFAKVEPEIRQLDISGITQLNNSIFKYIESFSETADESEISKAAENLNKYFELLPLISKEYMMHFISLCSAQIFPKTLVFMTEHCGDLYSKILASIRN